ncbi:hypothetical protein DFR50_10587 [Roseiarcus fermentans]|uniref:Outer membrane beta-barrel porin/alpha-amylase n=1 Tax=Roseiarcus fermentans TaxID=1473586 RepID=A0A366FRT2_9HYPH|nr:neuromedin U [Roseiarcus fermentans]RBP16445.1 hypothetical protein DFR50_10587 [Roseiarcus fermentans]
MKPTFGLLCAALLVASPPSLAQTAQPAGRQPLVGDDAKDESDSELAKQIQNPVGDLISFPLQNNVNFGYGPHGGAQNVLNLQPVIPFHITDDWNLITRTILPVVWNPDAAPIPTVPAGTAPTSFTAFLSPRRAVDGWLWGAGPVVQIPTISSTTLGSSVWGGGPSAAIVWSGGPWVTGTLFNAIWSMGGAPGPSGNSYATFLANPFVAYNLDDGWYVSTGPNVTANWQAPGTKWTVPVGGGAGRTFRVGSLPVDLSLSAYYNAVRPTAGALWQLSTQLTFIF